MEEILHGIVLGGVSYGDNDKILTVFTLERGSVCAKIKGVKKAGAKLKFASEPFCFAEFVFSKSGERRTVIGASLLDSFYPLRNDLKTLYLASSCLEFVKRFDIENIVSKEQFSALVEVLKTLSYGKQEDRLKAVVKFYLTSLSLSGYALNLPFCPICHEEIEGRVFFEYQRGAFFCANCKSDKAIEIRHDTYLAISRIDEEEFKEADYLNALKLIDYYIERKTEESISSLKESIKIY
jgi:DNA repair protein RecO (recombination protein O)